MRYWLAIDPGIHTGYAVVETTGTLVHAGAGQVWNIDPRSFAGAVIELPMVYPKTSAKQANDLITLAVRVGEYKDRLQAIGLDVELVWPTTWKGSIPKAPHHARGKSVMTPRENAIVDAVCKANSSCKEDIRDAVNLALWKVGRLPKSGQSPR